VPRPPSAPSETASPEVTAARETDTSTPVRADLRSIRAQLKRLAPPLPRGWNGDNPASPREIDLSGDPIELASQLPLFSVACFFSACSEGEWPEDPRNAYPPARSPANAGRGPGAVARLFRASYCCLSSGEGGREGAASYELARPALLRSVRVMAGVPSDCIGNTFASRAPVPSQRPRTRQGQNAVWQSSRDRRPEHVNLPADLSVRADCSHTCLAGLAGVGGDHRTIWTDLLP